jgi:hypothetical protein
MRAAIGTRLSSVRAKEHRSPFLPIKASLLVRRYTDRFALRLQLDEPAIYPLQRSCERRFKNLNPPPKTDAAPPPIRDVESTQNGLPVEFLDHEALADTEAAACLGAFLPAAARPPSGFYLYASILSHRSPLRCRTLRYACQIIIPTLSQRAFAPSLLRPAIGQPTIPPLPPAVRRAPCATRSRQMTFGRSSRVRVSPSQGRRPNMRCHSGA